MNPGSRDDEPRSPRLMGPLMHFVAGVIFNFRQFGNPSFNIIAVGSDILIVAGVALLINVNWVTYNLFIASQLLGGPVCILGKNNSFSLSSRSSG